jgi:TIR domain-containing protein
LLDRKLDAVWNCFSPIGAFDVPLIEIEKFFKKEEITMSLPAEWMEFAPKPREFTSGDQWNVFLSYRSVSRPWVLNLYDVLREQGHKVFLDQCVLKAEMS